MNKLIVTIAFLKFKKLIYFQIPTPGASVVNSEIYENFILKKFHPKLNFPAVGKEKENKVDLGD